MNRAAFVGAAAALALATALVVGLAGGGSQELAGVRLSVREPLRALIAGLVLGSCFLLWRVCRAPIRARSGAALDALTDLAFWTLCLSIAGVWLAYRVSACGGLDSYAYVSTAYAMVGGHLRLPEPLGMIVPFPQGPAAAAPPGWMPGSDGRSILPEFPPGLPLVMALFLRVGGDAGPYWVSPLFGVVAMLAVYGLARQVAGRDVARVAAVATAAHPVFVTQAIQPMSDVAATAWLVLAVLLLTRDRPHPLLAGACALMAVWTRPPLVAAAAVALCLPRCAGAGRLRLRYGAMLMVAGAALAALQWALYGNPFLTGRGSAGDLFRPERVPGNIVNYAWWFTVVHTPLVYVALVAALWKSPLVRIHSMFLCLFAVEAAPYLAYLEFDHWETLRYWLPGLPFVLIVASAGVVRLLSRVRRDALLRAGAVLTAWIVAATSFVFLRQQTTFHLWQSENRFRVVAGLISLETKPSDVVLADVHSGSLRLYAHRSTLRYQAVPPEALEPTVRALMQDGRRTVVVLDDWVEEEQFRRQFAMSLPRLRIASEWRVRGVKVQALAPMD
jgi:hypothetical protein